ncbi:MAG: hypothetical protein K0S33_1425 [Bacteroidetes bacterium]|nr:hypothetical protein [Bacteroidota bacterium]
MKNKKPKTHCASAAFLPRITGWLGFSIVCISGSMYAQETSGLYASQSHREEAVVSATTEQQPNPLLTGVLIGNSAGLPENKENDPAAKKNFLFRSDDPYKGTGPGDAANYTGEGKTAVLKSIIVPGWGLYAASQRPLSWINLPVCYGLVGYGVYQMTAGSEKQYQKYMDLRVPGEMDKQFDKSNTTFVTGIGVTCAGALLWIRQVIVTSNWAKKNEFYRKRAKIWNENLAFTLAPVPMKKQATGFCLSATLKLN